MISLFSWEHREEFAQRIRCSMRAGIGATFRKPGRVAQCCRWCSVESRLHLPYISFHFSFQLWNSQIFLFCAPHVSRILLRAEARWRGCSVSLCNYLKKYILLRYYLIRDTSGLIMLGENVCGVGSFCARSIHLAVFSSHQQQLIFICILREYSDVRFAVVRIKLT